MCVLWLSLQLLLNLSRSYVTFLADQKIELATVFQIGMEKIENINFQLKQCIIYISSLRDLRDFQQIFEEDVTKVKH